MLNRYDKTTELDYGLLNNPTWSQDLAPTTHTNIFSFTEESIAQ